MVQLFLSLVLFILFYVLCTIYLYVQYPVEGIAALHVRKAHVLHARYMQCPLTLHAPHVQIHENVCNFMCNQMQLEVILHVKLLAVVQLELIKCV